MEAMSVYESVMTYRNLIFNIKKIKFSIKCKRNAVFPVKLMSMLHKRDIKLFKIAIAILDSGILIEKC